MLNHYYYAKQQTIMSRLKVFVKINLHIFAKQMWQIKAKQMKKPKNFHKKSLLSKSKYKLVLPS